jgi:Zn-dependent peptidase ImmA (M78 family)
VHPNSEDTEWQANIFAGALLMPLYGLRAVELERGELNAREVAAHFAVSQGAARTRIAIYVMKRRELERA